MEACIPSFYPTYYITIFVFFFPVSSHTTASVQVLKPITCLTAYYLFQLRQLCCHLSNRIYLLYYLLEERRFKDRKSNATRSEINTSNIMCTIYCIIYSKRKYKDKERWDILQKATPFTYCTSTTYFLSLTWLLIGLHKCIAVYSTYKFYCLVHLQGVRMM